MHGRDRALVVRVRDSLPHRGCGNAPASQLWAERRRRLLFRSRFARIWIRLNSLRSGVLPMVIVRWGSRGLVGFDLYRGGRRKPISASEIDLSTRLSVASSTRSERLVLHGSGVLGRALEGGEPADLRGLPPLEDICRLGSPARSHRGRTQGRGREHPAVCLGTGPRGRRRPLIGKLLEYRRHRATAGCAHVADAARRFVTRNLNDGPGCGAGMYFTFSL